MSKLKIKPEDRLSLKIKFQKNFQQLGKIGRSDISWLGKICRDF